MCNRNLLFIRIVSYYHIRKSLRQQTNAITRSKSKQIFPSIHVCGRSWDARAVNGLVSNGSIFKYLDSSDLVNMSPRLRLWAKRALVAAVSIVCVELGVLVYTTPRLPRAPGPVKGVVPGVQAENEEVEVEENRPVQVLVFGDSVACGVGCPSNEAALAGAFSRNFCGLLAGRKVVWTVLAESGYTADDMTKKLVPALLKRKNKVHFDVVLISVGVNALLSAQLPSTYREQLIELLQSLRAAVGMKTAIVCMGMPPMHMFPQISYLKPLSWLVGWYASFCNEATHAACTETGEAVVVDVTIPRDASENPGMYMAPDGFHPNRKACDYFAAAMAIAAFKEMGVRSR